MGTSRKDFPKLNLLSPVNDGVVYPTFPKATHKKKNLLKRHTFLRAELYYLTFFSNTEDVN